MFPLQEIDMARKIMYLAIYYGKIGKTEQKIKSLSEIFYYQ